MRGTCARTSLPGPRAPTLSKARRAGGPQPLGGPEGRAAACGTSGAAGEKPEAAREVSPAADASSAAGRTGGERSVRRALRRPPLVRRRSPLASRPNKSPRPALLRRARSGGWRGAGPERGRGGRRGVRGRSHAGWGCPGKVAGPVCPARARQPVRVWTRRVPRAGRLQGTRPARAGFCARRRGGVGGRTMRQALAPLLACFPAAPGRPLPPNAQKLSPCCPSLCKVGGSLLRALPGCPGGGDSGSPDLPWDATAG